MYNFVFDLLVECEKLSYSEYDKYILLMQKLETYLINEKKKRKRIIMPKINKDINYMYCMFNKINSEYSATHHFLNDIMANRWFDSLMLKMAPGGFVATDFQLFYIGTFNVSTGEIVADKPIFKKNAEIVE